MPSTRKTVTQLSNLTAGQVASGEIDGPTASITLDSNIDFATTGATNPSRVPIYIPAPVISAKAGPPIDYLYYEECRSDASGAGGHHRGANFINGYDVPGSTAQAIYNAPPTVYLHWRGAATGFTSEWLNHNPRYFLYYYTYNQYTYKSTANPGKVYSPNRNRKWRHPLDFHYPDPAPYSSIVSDRIYNRSTEWDVNPEPTMISALNFDTGPTASWNDGFHPNQYLLAYGAIGATTWGSNPFPFGATVPYQTWGKAVESMEVSGAYLTNASPSLFSKRITLAFKFRIAIEHPQDPGRLMFGPYSETLLIKPEIGLFTDGLGATGYYYYGWHTKVK